MDENNKESAYDKDSPYLYFEFTEFRIYRLLIVMMALSAKQLSRIEVERATPALPALIIMLALFLVSNFAYGGASRGFCPECRVFLAENETLHFRPSLRDMGDFKIAYYPPKDPDSLRFDQEFYDSMIAFLNAAFILPKDILVVFTECGQGNAFYDPADAQIVMCHEFVEAVVDAFAFTELSDREFEDAVHATELFVLFHEVGHALIDVFDIPITGKEEDAVDQLSAMILIGNNHEDDALYAAKFFLQIAETDTRKLPFWDEHSLNKQRFYNIICWVYGSDPRAHRYLLREAILPKNRARRCVAEYKQLSSSWLGLLGNFLKVHR